MSYIIPLEALKALDAIDRKGSFAAAAEELYKVPSSLTYTIKKVEEDIGAELFDRSQHKAQLTEAGRIVLKQGREILHASDKLVKSVMQYESGWEREIRIARDTMVAECKLLEVCKQFEQLNKQVDISLSVEVLGGVWDALYSEKVDIVVGGAGEPPTGNYGTHKIGELDFIFAVSPSHPLAYVNSIIRQEDLKEYSSVVIADTSRSLPVQSSGYYYSNRIIRVSTIESKINFQLHGIGVGFLPKHKIQPYIDAGTLIEKECEVAKPKQDLYVAWSRKNEGKALKWFVKHLCTQNWMQ